MKFFFVEHETLKELNYSAYMAASNPGHAGEKTLTGFIGRHFGWI